jgi:hypothetical protein
MQAPRLQGRVNSQQGQRIGRFLQIFGFNYSDNRDQSTDPRG